MINPYEPPVTESEWTSMATVTRKPLDARMVVVAGLLIPGLPSLLMRRSSRGIFYFVMLLLTIPLALLFFGPFWDLVLFAGSDFGQAGLYPFLATCVLTPVFSVWLGFRDRASLLRKRLE